MKQEFLICFLQHRNVGFSLTAFLHLHAALLDKDDLKKKCKIVFACTSHGSSELRNLKNYFSNDYDIDIFECDGSYPKKIQAILKCYAESDYLYFIKHDEDVFVSSESWVALLTQAEKTLADSQNLLLSVNLSTGIPSWSYFAREFFNPKVIQKILADLSLSSLPPSLWGNDYSPVNDFIDSRISWDENGYWQSVNGLNYDYRGIHPVRLNVEFADYINREILSHYADFQLQQVDSQIDSVRDRYFCNSFFCMKYSQYREIFNDQSLYVDIFDEVPINRYAKVHKKNFCFLKQSLAVHLLYNSIYEQKVLINGHATSGKRLEEFFLNIYFTKICKYLESKSNIHFEKIIFGSESFFHRLKRVLRRHLSHFFSKAFDRFYRP